MRYYIQYNTESEFQYFGVAKPAYFQWQKNGSVQLKSTIHYQTFEKLMIILNCDTSESAHRIRFCVLPHIASF